MPQHASIINGHVDKNLCFITLFANKLIKENLLILLFLTFYCKFLSRKSITRSGNSCFAVDDATILR